MASTHKQRKKRLRAKAIKKASNFWHNSVPEEWSHGKNVPQKILDNAKKRFV